MSKELTLVQPRKLNVERLYIRSSDTVNKLVFPEGIYQISSFRQMAPARILLASETVTGYFLLSYPGRRTEQDYRLHLSVKNLLNTTRALSTFKSNIDILLIYFGKYLKLMCVCYKSNSDCYSMVSNEIGNEVTCTSIVQKSLLCQFFSERSIKTKLFVLLCSKMKIGYQGRVDLQVSDRHLACILIGR